MVRKTNAVLDNQPFAWVNSRIFLLWLYRPRCCHCKHTVGSQLESTPRKCNNHKPLWKRSILTNPPVEDLWSTSDSVEIAAMQHRNVHWQPVRVSNTGSFRDLVGRGITWPTWVMKAPKPDSPEGKARKLVKEEIFLYLVGPVPSISQFQWLPRTSILLKTTGSAEL